MLLFLFLLQKGCCQQAQAVGLRWQASVTLLRAQAKSMLCAALPDCSLTRQAAA
jgi:hypothetical protein